MFTQLKLPMCYLLNNSQNLWGGGGGEIMLDFFLGGKLEILLM